MKYERYKTKKQKQNDRIEEKKDCKQLKSYLNGLHGIYIDEWRFQFSGLFSFAQIEYRIVWHFAHYFHQLKMNSHCHRIRVHNNSSWIEFNVQGFWCFVRCRQFEHLNSYENRMEINETARTR